MFANLENPNIVRYYSSWIDIDIESIIEFNKNVDDDILSSRNSNKSISKFCPILFIQMELCDFTLKEYIMSTMSCDSVEKRIEYFKQIASGLDYLHNNNIIHRDLKPDNIFFVKKMVSRRDWEDVYRTNPGVNRTNPGGIRRNEVSEKFQSDQSRRNSKEISSERRLGGILPD